MLINPVNDSVVKHVIENFLNYIKKKLKYKRTQIDT